MDKLIFSELIIVLIFVGIMTFLNIWYLLAPKLLRSRLNAKEQENEQKTVIGFSAIMFVSAFILAGLNYRFKWFFMPESVVYISCIIFLLAYLMFGEVLRENEFLSRTIEVSDDQHVVDTGLYGIIRHPMYTATIFLFLSMPLILNCIYSFVIMLSYIPITIKRIRNEEEVLERELKGYKEYKQKVKYRIIPSIY